MFIVEWEITPKQCKRSKRYYNFHLDFPSYPTLFNCTPSLQVYKDNPENTHALSALARISTDMGLKEADHYREELSKLERMQESRMTSSRGASTRFGPPSRMGSSRAAQRPNPNDLSFDDNRSDLNSDYDPRERGAGDVFGEEDDMDLELEIRQQQRRPNTSRGFGSARPRTSGGLEDINAFFAANEVGSEVLPI